MSIFDTCILKMALQRRLRKALFATYCNFSRVHKARHVALGKFGDEILNREASISNCVKFLFQKRTASLPLVRLNDPHLKMGWQ